jgi:hypothetical protein
VDTLRKAVCVLLEHELAVRQGNEDVADELLADLETHLRGLTGEQNEWLRNLSGDLSEGNRTV